MPSPVKQITLDAAIPVFQPVSLKKRPSRSWRHCNRM